MRKWILGTLTFILIGAILFEPSYGWRLRQSLTPSGMAQGDTTTLMSENASLKAQLAVLGAIAAQTPQESQNYIRAMVYSRYPLNFKNEVLVSVGARDGVATGTAVVFEGMFMGRVVQVFPSEALVQTVFDSGFQMPVRVSTSSYDALLRGGSYPQVASISKTAALQAGDVVYTAAPGLPYGLPIGEIVATSTSPDSLFEEATLSFPYDINDVQSVLIAQGT
jgi:cell shape-determining protein MreC